MAFPGVPNFPSGLMLQSGDRLNDFVHNTLSVDSNLKAFQGGGQQFATLIDAVVCVVTRVTNIGDSIQLPPTNGRLGFGPYLGGLEIIIVNSTSNACQVFGNFFENCTVGGVSGAVGVSLPAGASLSLCCGAARSWIVLTSGGAGGGLPLTGGALSGILGVETAQGIIGAGTTSQANSTLLSTQVAVISSFPSSGVSGVRLPRSQDIVGALGPIWLKNKDPANNGLVYPPVGGQIDSFGTNSPVIINSLDEINFVPGTVTGQWWS